MAVRLLALRTGHTLLPETFFFASGLEGLRKLKKRYRVTPGEVYTF
jgi:hypothetical protein